MDGTQLGFFAPQPLLKGSANAMGTISLGHLLWAIYCVALIVGLVFLYKRLEPGLEWGRPRRKMMLAVASAVIFLVVASDVIMIAYGVFTLIWWPLNVCNICEDCMLIYALRPNRFCGEMLFTLGIGGGCAAILFPNWSDCPAFSFPVAVGFTNHALVIAFAIMLIHARDFVPRLRDYWMPALFVVVYAFISYPFNKIFNTNFGFTNITQHDSPLEFLVSVFGNPGFVLPYALLVLTIILAMYLFWEAWEKHHVRAC